VDAIDSLRYNADGLIPAIVQDAASGEVLMLAYMNRESIRKTVETGLATYWSRSRREFWVKGETSGHVQRVRSLAVDCDADTILMKVDQTGPACHENYRSCFFRDLKGEDLVHNGVPKLDHN
jgi:phosphoribosyl-AMP cyclohydrolase